MGVAKKDDPLDALRPLMAAHDPPLSAIVIPSEDAHQSEYVADRDKRRSFVSGFTGSAGLAVVTQTDALLWTDGRYFLQAEQQLTSRWKLMRIGEDLQVENWLADNLPSGGTVGVDPWCISVSNAQRWEDVLSKRGQKVIQCHQNLVDIVWEDRPSEKICPVIIHPVQFTGRTTKEKLHDLRTKMQQEKAFAMVVSALDEVAWLYNLRGNDVLYNPVVHSFAIVTADAAYYYVDNRKVGAEVTNYLKENDIVIKTYDEILQDLEALISSHQHPAKDPGMEADGVADSDEAMPQQVTKDETKEIEKGTATSCNMIWIDPNTCNLIIYSKLPAERVILQQSPIAISKALKHPVELEGLRNSHIRDGAAVVSYMAWLDQQMKDIYGAAGYFSESKPSNKRKCSETERLTEVSVADKLEEFRAKQQYFRGLSFETISSVGANAAVIHYAPSADNCAEMLADAIYLCDSGGQYLDGTTDVTRTMHFGKPTPHERSCFTQVLKGHIALDTVVFPSGTTGHALDILARVPLWMSGLDYRHGTGHGVGCYLNVHEGPHLISFRPQARNVPLQATMTVTDEPGYYEDGNFGIRLENVLIVKEAETEHNFGDKGYLGFEHITWVPFQVKMIDLSLLTASEKAWVDNYHEVCRQKLAPLLSGSDLEWLVKATESLA